MPISWHDEDGQQLLAGQSKRTDRWSETAAQFITLTDLDHADQLAPGDSWQSTCLDASLEEYRNSTK